MEGFDVQTAMHGRAALDCIQDGYWPGLIILDLMMPVMDGFEFVTELRKNPTRSTIPIIVMTGYSNPDERAAPLSVTATVPKPVDINDLLIVVRRALSQA